MKTIAAIILATVATLSFAQDVRPGTDPSGTFTLFNSPMAELAPCEIYSIADFSYSTNANIIHVSMEDRQKGDPRALCPSFNTRGRSYRLEILKKDVCNIFEYRGVDGESVLEVTDFRFATCDIEVGSPIVVKETLKGQSKTTHGFVRTTEFAACGYFNMPPANDPEYIEWLKNQLPPVIDPNPITQPVERYFFVVKTRVNGTVDFKSYELVASGSNSLEASLRHSIISLMDTSKKYCIQGKLSGINERVLIKSARKATR